MTRRTLLLVSVFAMCGQLSAEPPSADQFLAQTAGHLKRAIETHRDSFETNPHALYAEFDRILEPVVDFEAISRGVFGKYRSRATAAQLKGFTEVFQVTLIQMFSRAMVSLRAESFAVDPSPVAKGPRASVTMNVMTATGSNCEVSFSLALQSDRWLVRNVVLHGINLGLTYRSQFDGLVVEHGGDIGMAISHWAEALSASQPLDIAASP